MIFFRKIWPSGNDTWKLIDFQVSLPRNQSISVLQYPEIDRSPEIVPWRLIDFQVTIPERQTKDTRKHRKKWKKFKISTISVFCIPETNQFPGKVPGNRYEKNLISWISPRKRKYFRKYFGGLLPILIHEKSEFGNLMLVSL